MQQLIEELQNAEINNEAKKKTIDTLNAITGMLDSLRNNKVFDENKVQRERNNSLKSKFDVRLINIFLNIIYRIL